MSLIHRVLRKPFFGRFEVPWRMPEGESEEIWQRVSIPSPTGASLAGLVGEAAADPVGALVLAHPMGKAAKGFWLRYGHADLFRRAGFHVLVFDFNGFGESEAVSFDYPSDALAAGRFAQARYPLLPVGLVAASFGAGWGLCSMARVGSPYRAAVLEGVFPSLPEFWRHYPVAYACLRASQLVWPRMERAMRPERHAAGIVGSPDVLLIHGDADPFTPPEHGERVRRAMHGRARADLWVLPGVEHTFAYRDQRDAYAGRVVPFLRRALRGS
jgi:alpha-beta hydrolase superfamily lysophospholipase